jgi:hypothetical protein
MTMSSPYIMLMASLPPLGDLFGQQQTPLSELQLQQRLKFLTEQDRRTLTRIEQLLRRSKQPKEWTDAQIVRSAKALVNDLKSPVLKEAVEFVMELRTIGVAFRRRRLGQNTPPTQPDWGYSRWLKRIENHWTEPDFGLGVVMPLVARALPLLDGDDPIELERLVLAEVWKRFNRLSQGHYFDFPAVALYVLRWSLINRRVNYNREIALKRFNSLINDGIGNFRELFPAKAG